MTGTMSKLANFQIPALKELSDVSFVQNTNWVLTCGEDGKFYLAAQSGGSTGAGVPFYFDKTVIIPITLENDIEVRYLTGLPSYESELTRSVVANNNSVIFDFFEYNLPLNRDKWNQGIWEQDIWAKVDATDLGNSEIIVNIGNMIFPTGYTASTTGVGTTRTLTISSGTLFLPTDASLDPKTQSFARINGSMAQGCHPIIAYNSPTSVDIQVPITFTNITNEVFFLSRHNHYMSTGTITNTVDFQKYEMESPEAGIAVALNDRITATVIGKTTRPFNTTIEFTINGSTRYSNFKTPFLSNHDDLNLVRLAGFGVPYGHISDGAQDIYGDKTCYGFLHARNVFAAQIYEEDPNSIGDGFHFKLHHGAGYIYPTLFSLAPDQVVLSATGLVVANGCQIKFPTVSTSDAQWVIGEGMHAAATLGIGTNGDDFLLTGDGQLKVEKFQLGAETQQIDEISTETVWAAPTNTQIAPKLAIKNWHESLPFPNPLVVGNFVEYRYKPAQLAAGDTGDFFSPNLFAMLTDFQHAEVYHETFVHTSTGASYRRRVTFKIFKRIEGVISSGTESSLAAIGTSDFTVDGLVVIGNFIRHKYSTTNTIETKQMTAIIRWRVYTMTP